METFKFILSITVLITVLSCSKLPFFNKENEKSKQKEEELKKREDDLKQKEDALKDEKIKQLEEDKAEFKKRGEELEQKIKDTEVESKFKASGSPADITLALIQNIDAFCVTGNESSLMSAYDLWYRPLSSIGSYEKFRNGFTNTLSDKVLDNTVISNDGFNAEVLITHSAYEVNLKSSGVYDAYQKTKYEAKYKLISDNGSWKILSGKVTILSREYSEYYR